MGFSVRQVAIAALLAAAISGASASAQGLADPSQPVAAGQDRSASDWATAKAEAEAQTAVYTAAKAAADARKAAVEAEVAADRARFGGVNALSGVTLGATEAGTEPGKAEAMLLATKATKDAAARMITDLAAGLDSRPRRPVILLASMDELTIGNAIQFDAQMTMFGESLQQSGASCQDAMAAAASVAPTRGAGTRSAFAAGGAILESAAKLASYFQTDYKFGTVTLSEPTNITVALVSAAVQKARPGRQILVPTNMIVADVSSVAAPLAQLQASAATAAGCAAAAKAKATAVRQASPGLAAQLDAAEARATRNVAAFDQFASALLTASEAKPAPIVNVLRQKKLQALLGQGDERKPLILLVTNSKAGAYYTKKNLWTFLAGSPPLYTMGGVALAYNLFEADSGLVLASGAVAEHGGYQSVGATERLFRTR